jgi:hypothetical protein
MDYTKDYLCICKDTTLNCGRIVAKVLIRAFSFDYLQDPNEEDTKRLMEINEATGWPGIAWEH